MRKVHIGAPFGEADSRAEIFLRHKGAGRENIFSAGKQMEEHEGITEKLKPENQMLWAGKMNAIRETVTEIINNDLIHA